MSDGQEVNQRAMCRRCSSARSIRAGHRLALSLGPRPFHLCVGGAAQIEGDLTEDLEAFLRSQGHPGLPDFHGPFGRLGQPLQPGDFLMQVPLPGPQPLQRVHLWVVEDHGDLVEGEAELA
jgi:hypothetical protein